VRKAFQELSDEHKRQLLMALHVLPDTKSIKNDISKAIDMGVEVEYACDQKECNFGPVLKALQNNPKFRQMGSADILEELVEQLQKNQDLLGARSLDFFLYQRTKTPVLLMTNKTPIELRFGFSGVSSFLEINDLRQRMLKRYDPLESKSYSDDYFRIVLIGVTIGATASALIALKNTVSKLVGSE
jgi:hypothetical protein